MRILIIEDEEKLAQSLKESLEAEGFAADYVLDGEAGQTRIELHHTDYDLIVLDLMLPKKDGMEVCRQVRVEGIVTPILMLTARDASEYKIEGLEIGADDYLTKPFLFKELIARIRALLRRPHDALPPANISVGKLSLHPSTHEVFYGTERIPVTLKEFSLLEYLMRNKNRALEREQILAHVWDFELNSFSNLVDVHIKNLRNKLEHESSRRIIETVYGVGYRIKDPA